MDVNTMSEYAFYGKNGFKYGVDKITSDALVFHKRNILQLLKEIKGIDVDESYFINDDNRYLWRDKLSYFCVYNNKVIGIIFSYFKKSDKSVPFDSVYVHRLVINPEHRNNSVAEHLLKYCIKTYFETIPFLYKLHLILKTNQLYLFILKLASLFLGSKNIRIKQIHCCCYKALMTIPLQKIQR